MGNLRAALGPATTFLKTLFADYGSPLHRGSSGMQKLQGFLIQGGVSYICVATESHEEGGLPTHCSAAGTTRNCSFVN